MSKPGGEDRASTKPEWQFDDDISYILELEAWTARRYADRLHHRRRTENITFPDGGTTPFKKGGRLDYLRKAVFTHWSPARQGFVEPGTSRPR